MEKGASDRPENTLDSVRPFLLCHYDLNMLTGKDLRSQKNPSRASDLIKDSRNTLSLLPRPKEEGLACQTPDPEVTAVLFLLGDPPLSLWTIGRLGGPLGDRQVPMVVTGHGQLCSKTFLTPLSIPH